jgi:hypothetical protein
MVAGAVGLVLSVNLWREKVSRDLRGKHTQAYIGAMIAYFAAGLIMNMITQVCFVRNRCQDHNLNFVNYAKYDARYRPRDDDGWLDVSTSSSKWAKSLYLTMNFTGGFLANSLMELALLRRIIVMEGTESFASHIKIVKWLIYCMLVMNLLALPLTLFFYLKMMDEGVDAIGGVESGDTITAAFNVVAVIYAALHIYISLVLIRVFVTIMRNFSEHPRAIAKVMLCTMCAIVSTFLVYGNMAAMLVNAYVMLPMDCLINQICMIILNFTGSYKGEFRKSFFRKNTDCKEFSTEEANEDAPRRTTSIGSSGSPRYGSGSSRSPKSNFAQAGSVSFSIKGSVQSLNQMARDAKSALFPTSYANLDEDQLKATSELDESRLHAIGLSQKAVPSTPPGDPSKLSDAHFDLIRGKTPLQAGKYFSQSSEGSATTPQVATPKCTGGLKTGHFTVDTPIVQQSATPLGRDFSSEAIVDADEGVLGDKSGRSDALTPQAVDHHIPYVSQASGHTPFTSQATGDNSTGNAPLFILSPCADYPTKPLEFQEAGSLRDAGKAIQETKDGKADLYASPPGF